MTAPPETLLDLQRWFSTLETRPMRESGPYKIPLYPKTLLSQIETRISAGPHLSSAQRIGLYNQQYWWRLFNLLQDRYPALYRLFGAADFNHLLAEPYLLHYPPDDWSLNDLGAHLPQYIHDHYCEEDRPLILPLAYLENIDHLLPYAYPLPSLQPADLDKPIFLQPTLALLSLNADLFSFRNQLLEREPIHWETHDLPSIAPFPETRHFLLSPDSVPQPLSPPEFTLLNAFLHGATLTDACSLLSDAPDISTWFQSWILNGYLTCS